MKENRINKAPESRMVGKVLSMIDHLYPTIENEARRIFIDENKEAMKIIKRKFDFRLAFHAWFILKFEFPSGATGMEMADSFPMDFFNKDEKIMIKNFLNYKESLFKILKISRNKRDYKIKDLIDKRIYLIKTLDFPAEFLERQLIKSAIIKNIEGDYFFYGSVQLFNIKDRSNFIREMISVLNIEKIIREKRKEGIIEWEFDKENKHKKDASQP